MAIWAWFLLGAGTWALAVVLKVVADLLVQRSLKAELRDWLAALLSGIWSSFCELGLAALAFWIWSATFADALVVATGAAMAEFLVLLPAAISANWNKKGQSKTKEAAGWNAFFSERGVIFANHLASRSLVWLSIGGSGDLAAIASAFGLFALIEAVQAYGEAKEWDWLNKRVLWTYLTVLCAVVAIEIVLLVLWSL
jgi:hypothetical protein